MVSISKVLELVSEFEETATLGLNKVAKKEEKKLDPKAKVRNRGKCVFPAESPKVKDSTDHFPINTEKEGHAALAYAGKYTSAPSWYRGSLTELKEAVRRAVHKAFPKIEISKSAQLAPQHIEPVSPELNAESVIMSALPDSIKHLVDKLETHIDELRVHFKQGATQNVVTTIQKTVNKLVQQNKLPFPMAVVPV